MVLWDKSASLKHGEIVCEGGRTVVKDKESKYGIQVQNNEKGMKFQVGRRLKAFQIGNIVFAMKIIEVYYNDY